MLRAALALIWRCIHLRENDPIVRANCQVESTLKTLIYHRRYRNGTRRCDLRQREKGLCRGSPGLPRAFPGSKMKAKLASPQARSISFRWDFRTTKLRMSRSLTPSLVVTLDLGIDGHNTATARFWFLSWLVPQFVHNFCASYVRNAIAAPIRAGSVLSQPTRAIPVVLIVEDINFARA